MASVVVDSGNFRDNVLIQADTLNINPPATLPGVDPLEPHVAYEAMHDSGEVDAQGDCHPGTRIAIQDIIKQWAEDPRPNTLVNLMIGAAGAGKSAIMRTIAKVLEKKGLLIGGFFCFRSSPRRNDGSFVIPTFVAQMVERIPDLRPLVYKAFEDNKGLITKAMDIQALKLIIEPLNSIGPTERSQWPHVVLLDGLDEINGVAAQQAIVRVFAYINRHLVSPLHFLIASRPEPPILQAFDEFSGGRWSRLELDDSFKPNDDIDLFYINHFQKICDHNSYLPRGWPGGTVRRILVDKGSGKFIFASVVVGVVSDPSSPLSPQERLDLVLEVTKRDDLQPLERLDLLYVSVLCRIPEIVRPQVLRILAVILAAGDMLKHLSPTPRFFDALFYMPSGTTRHRLCHLHSVLDIPADDVNVISPQHATLGDFVFDKARSEQFGFHVNKKRLVEDTFLQIAEALQSNPDKMIDAFGDFLKFFNSYLEYRVNGESLAPEMIQKLQSYQLTALSSPALMVYAAPLALSIESSRTFRPLHNISRSIIKEAHRRAHLYCNDYGTQGATLLAIGAMYASYPKGIPFTIAQDWNPTPAFRRQFKESPILSIDRSSGLGLMPGPDELFFGNTPWQRVLTRNGWLCSYLHLLTRPDIVQSLARSGRAMSTVWRVCLPVDSSTVSALRATLSSAQPEHDDEDFSGFLQSISFYLEDHWKKSWRVPSLLLLRKDWNKWKEGYDRAKRARG